RPTFWRRNELPATAGLAAGLRVRGARGDPGRDRPGHDLGGARRRLGDGPGPRGRPDREHRPRGAAGGGPGPPVGPRAGGIPGRGGPGWGGRGGGGPAEGRPGRGGPVGGSPGCGGPGCDRPGCDRPGRGGPGGGAVMAVPADTPRWLVGGGPRPGSPRLY